MSVCTIHGSWPGPTCPGCTTSSAREAPRSQTCRCRMCGIVFQGREAQRVCPSCWTAEHLGEGIGDTRVPTLGTDPPFSLSKKLGPKSYTKKPAPPPVKNLWQRLAEADEDEPT